MADPIYELSENPVYNEAIRAIQDSDPALASAVFTPLFTAMLNNTHFVKLLAEQTAAALSGKVSKERLDIKATASQMIINPWQPGTCEQVIEAATGDTYKTVYGSSGLTYEHSKAGEVVRAWRCATSGELSDKANVHNGHYSGNIDGLRTSGVWVCVDPGGTLPPGNASWFTLAVFPGGTGSAIQIASLNGGAGQPCRTCVRHHNGVGWDAWSPLATSADLSGKADVGHTHTAAQVGALPVSGGAVTGPVSAPKLTGAKVLAGQGKGGGYSFAGDGEEDTGLFSDSDGDLYFMKNGAVYAFRPTPAEIGAAPSGHTHTAAQVGAVGMITGTYTGTSSASGTQHIVLGTMPRTVIVWNNWSDNSNNQFEPRFSMGVAYASGAGVEITADGFTVRTASDYNGVLYPDLNRIGRTYMYAAFY